MNAYAASLQISKLASFINPPIVISHLRSGIVFYCHFYDGQKTAREVIDHNFETG